MKQFITEAQRLQKLAGISEIKVIPSNKISAIKKMIATNFPQVIKRGNLRGASNEYFPILLAVAKMNGFDFDSEDDLIEYINNHSNEEKEVEKLIDGFKDALNDLNVNVTVNEIKITPSILGGPEIPKGWEQYEVDPEPDIDEDIEVEAYSAPMEGWDENNHDIVIIRKTPKDEYYVDVYIAFGDYEGDDKKYNSLLLAKQEAIEIMNDIKADWEDEQDLDEIKIIPSTPQLSRDTLIDKLIDLYVDLYGDESDSLLDILSKYIPDRIFYNSNLSYKEIFEILDDEDLLKLYSELNQL